MHSVVRGNCCLHNLSKIVWVVCLLLAMFTGCSPPESVPVQANVLMQELLQSPKLIFPQMILTDFINGRATTRVLVNLRDPEGVSGQRDLSDPVVRERLQSLVENVQNQVISTLHPAYVRVLRRFTYQFGFAAEVSLQGIQELVAHPDVISIESDHELEMQGK